MPDRQRLLGEGEGVCVCDNRGFVRMGGWDRQGLVEVGAVDKCWSVDVRDTRGFVEVGIWDGYVVVDSGVWDRRGVVDVGIWDGYVFVDSDVWGRHGFVEVGVWDRRRSADVAGGDLSLIHISEPTRLA